MTTRHVLGLMGEEGEGGEREGKETVRCRNLWRINAGKGRLIILLKRKY